ncbi:MAG: porin family protein [Bacteroidota bacterium]
MKKILLFSLVALLGINATTQAQLSISGQAGLNYATLGTDEPDASDVIDSKLGFYIGANATKDINDNLYVGAGLNYSTKGYSSSATVEFPGLFKVDTEGSSSLNYLEIPINIGYRVGDLITIQAGPYLGLLMGVSNKSKSTTLDYTTNTTTTAEDSDNDATGWSKSDFGLNIGAGLNVSESLSIRLNYGLGLANIMDDSAVSNTYKNNVLSVGIGYTFMK